MSSSLLEMFMSSGVWLAQRERANTRSTRDTQTKAPLRRAVVNGADKAGRLRLEGGDVGAHDGGVGEELCAATGVVMDDGALVD